VLPVIGAIIGAALAPLAFRQIRSTDPPMKGRGYATAGFIIGMVFGLLFGIVIAYIQRDEWGQGPLALGIVLTAVVVVFTMTEMRSRERVAVGGAVAGGVMMVLLSILALIGVAYLFAFAMGEALEAVGDSLSDSLSDAFDCTPSEP
jgi:uncharacterized membrane protein (UPF0136 family)